MLGAKTLAKLRTQLYHAQQNAIAEETYRYSFRCRNAEDEKKSAEKSNLYKTRIETLKQEIREIKKKPGYKLIFTA